MSSYFELAFEMSSTHDKFNLNRKRVVREVGIHELDSEYNRVFEYEIQYERHIFGDGR